MVVSISNDVLSNPVDSDAGEAIKLAFPAAVLAELFNEYAIRIKYLWKKYILNIKWNDVMSDLRAIYKWGIYKSVSDLRTQV